MQNETTSSQPATFADLGLSPKVLAAVVAAGYTTPTPIQCQAIPVAVTGRDILGIAQTGTGKTAAFTMPMITRLEAGRARARMPRSLILAPTRELATQVAQSFEKYGVNHKLDVALLIGGVAMDDQIRKLDRGVDVLIATPGRLLDHFGRGRIMLMGVEILVIDEADRMLDMGFIPDIEKICKLLPPKRQTLFFSATMPPEITRLTEQFLTDPVRIEVARPATTAKTIQQRFYYLDQGEDWAKREVLRDMIRKEPVKNAIIFCNRKRDVAILNKSLLKHGFNAGCLHGDMDQMSRTATLDKFRAGEINILAASDVAARGLDIPEVSHVFNFDIPWQADDYVHRIGRTGRAGREGFSASIVTAEDFKALAEISKITGEAPVWINEPPSDEEMAEGAKRRRGRGGRGARSGSSDGRRDGRDGGRDGGRRGRDGRGGERGPRRGDESSRRGDENSRRGDESSRRSDDISRRDDAPYPVEARAPDAESAPRAERPPRAPRPERGARDDRPERIARDDRRDPSERPERSERGPRPERPQRDDRHHRDERPRREERGQGEERSARGERPMRHDAPQPRREPPAGERRRESHTQERAQREPAQEPRREARPQRTSGSDQSSRETGVGFADNVPAFLRRPVRSV